MIAELGFRFNLAIVNITVAVTGLSTFRATVHLLLSNSSPLLSLRSPSPPENYRALGARTDSRGRKRVRSTLETFTLSYLSVPSRPEPATLHRTAQ